MKMIKRFTAVLMAALIMCSVLVFTGVSAADESFSTKISSNVQQAAPGDLVVFTVVVNDISSANGLIGVDLPFCFNSNAFEFVESKAKFPSAWKEPLDLSWDAAQNGVVWLRSIDDGGQLDNVGCTKDGDIAFTVTLRVLENAVTNKDYTVSVGNSDNKACGTVGITVVMAYANASSTKVGLVDKVDILRGDVDFSGTVGPLDASLILQHDAMLITLTYNQLKAADVDLNGKVGALDASLILQYDALLITWEQLDATLGN